MSLYYKWIIEGGLPEKTYILIKLVTQWYLINKIVIIGKKDEKKFNFKKSTFLDFR